MAVIYLLKFACLTYESQENNNNKSLFNLTTVFTEIIVQLTNDQFYVASSKAPLSSPYNVYQLQEALSSTAKLENCLTNLHLTCPRYPVISFLILETTKV